jgi:hypothetical protein
MWAEVLVGFIFHLPSDGFVVGLFGIIPILWTVSGDW